MTLAGPNGEDWRKYLRWDALQEELRGDKQPDKALLADVYKRYAAGEDGLELVWFLDVQHALRNYVATVNAVDNPQVRAAYDAMLDKLAESLEAYIAKPTADAALADWRVGAVVGGRRQAPALVRAIQYHFVHPNLLLEVSSDVVGAGIAEPRRRRYARPRLHPRHRHLRHGAHDGPNLRRDGARSQFRRDRHACFSAPP